MNHDSLAINSFQGDKDASKLFFFNYFWFELKTYILVNETCWQIFFSFQSISILFLCAILDQAQSQKNKCNYVFSSMLKFHLKSKQKVLTDNNRVEQWNGRLKDPGIRLTGHISVSLLSLQPFLKFSLLARKFSWEQARFWQLCCISGKTKTPGWFYCMWSTRNEVEASSTCSSPQSLQWPLRVPAPAAALAGDRHTQESPCRGTSVKMWHLSILHKRWTHCF